MGILAGIFVAALLQDLSFTAKTALVSRGHRTPAVAADVCAMVTSSLYLILTASVTMQSGLSFATAEAFAAIAIGGACGTIVGMFAVERLELRLTRKRPLSEGSTDQRQDGCRSRSLPTPAIRGLVARTKPSIVDCPGIRAPASGDRG